MKQYIMAILLSSLGMAAAHGQQGTVPSITWKFGSETMEDEPFYISRDAIRQAMENSVVDRYGLLSYEGGEMDWSPVRIEHGQIRPFHESWIDIIGIVVQDMPRDFVSEWSTPQKRLVADFLDRHVYEIRICKRICTPRGCVIICI